MSFDPHYPELSGILNHEDVQKAYILYLIELSKKERTTVIVQGWSVVPTTHSSEIIWHLLSLCRLWFMNNTACVSVHTHRRMSGWHSESPESVCEIERTGSR